MVIKGVELTVYEHSQIISLQGRGIDGSNLFRERGAPVQAEVAVLESGLEVELDEVDVREVELLLVGPVTGAELERIVVHHQVALEAADSGAYVDGRKGVTGESVVHFRLGVLSEL